MAYGGYSSTYGGASSYSSRLSADPYLSSASRYSNPSAFASASEITKYSSSSMDYGSSLYSNQREFGGIGGQSSWAGYDGAGLTSGMKRSAEALYQQNVLGSYNTIGQSDALFSSNSMFKHPRLETASSLPVYPQRPGEKDCAHYMQTRTCKFGEACKFDHPIWVPEGGIPDWKEVPLVPTTEALPERPGEPDCPYYMKTQKCKFGFRCKFNHPKDNLNALTGGGDGMGTGTVDPVLLPERPSEPICSFYSKTGKCKFGANCKFHHPKDLEIPSSGQNAGALQQVESAGGDSVPAKTFAPFTPALVHNSKGLPIRPGETDCPFYVKTGSCKYGATCRFNHPDRIAINPPLGGNIGQTVMPSAASLPIGLINSAANLIPSIDPLLAQASLGVSPAVYPQRPGEMACDFYMKTGQCKFGERCKFHHPIDRSAPNASVAQVQPNVKLTLAGLPRREGSVACPFYMKTGTCKYGVTCRFDHPPPGEAIAMATAAQGSETGVDAEQN
ncbi:uncharacterized protein A4U43_C05F28230 [Asparagus officinalis]|uniref:C3H1-type domain-containing protein n=1 Tax=Asparagus officinalis TaxID=4686 RepID=A0A5P1F0H0_ASPOF|nr:zinc finger CCCH domain-containing protein 8 [Asparagus officinalis]ONK69920.1 uncharacterized protein A4U43_C05F28230 [Asparagus officinalis]